MVEAAHLATEAVQATSLAKKLFVGATAITSFSAVVGASLSLSISTSPTVISGVTAYGTDLSGMTKTQVHDFLYRYYKDHADPIQLIDGDKTWYINPEDVDYVANVDQVTDEIFNLGRSGSFFHNLNEQINCYMHPRDFSLVGTYSPDKLNAKLNSIATEIHVDPVNADVYMNSAGEIVHVAGVVGRNWTPDPVAQSLDAPYRNLDTPKQIPIYPTSIQPFITTEDVNAVDTIIGQYTTYYYPGNRGDNIWIAASKLNASVIKPGTSFSFNDTVGNRTYSNGFLPAPVIVNGKHEIGIGGGVCQVSTTLYNAVLLAGLTPTERTPHYFPSSYVSPGRDATVADDVVDFKFRNDLNHVVALAARADGNAITCYILGSSADIAGKEISIVTDGSSMHPSVYRVTRTGDSVVEEYLHTDDYYAD